eukprot:7364397-Prymnesium_polylepis.2
MLSGGGTHGCSFQLRMVVDIRKNNQHIQQRHDYDELVEVEERNAEPRAHRFIGAPNRIGWVASESYLKHQEKSVWPWSEAFGALLLRGACHDGGEDDVRARREGHTHYREESEPLEDIGDHLGNHENEGASGVRDREKSERTKPLQDGCATKLIEWSVGDNCPVLDREQDAEERDEGEHARRQIECVEHVCTVAGEIATIPAKLGDLHVEINPNPP